MRIVFRTDSSTLIGTGHLIRCLTLAGAMKEKGAEVMFICRDHPGNILDEVTTAGFQLKVLKTDPESLTADRDEYAQWLGVSQEDDASQTLELLEKGASPDWLIVDHYGIDRDWERRLRASSGHIMVIDDLANRGHDCDLLLDQNLYENMEMRYEHLVPSDCRMLLGPGYAMLRPEFLKYRRQLPQRRGAIKRVLLFFGGADATNETAKALDAIELLQHDELIIEVVVGASNQNRDEIEAHCARIKNAHFHCQVVNMAALMASCDLAIGAGGTTTWERCCLGLPCLTIAVAENQIEVARMASTAGFARFLGSSSDVTAVNISELLLQIISAPETVRQMSQAGLDIVSGDGVDLVAALLSEMVVQPAQR